MENEIDTNEEVETTQEETIAEVETTEEKSEETRKERPFESLQDRKARLERQLEQTNKKLGVDVQKPENKSSKKSDGLDYGAKAYLTANGIKGTKEFEFVESELKASGEDIDSLLENNYFKSRLENFRALNKTADAIPTGKRSGAPAIDSVEYWIGKPIEEVPREMRVKVVNAKMSKDKNGGMFYNS